MDSRTLVERVMRNLSFQVEAIPTKKNNQDRSTSSKADPMNVTVKVRKKEMNQQYNRGFISNNQSEPEKMLQNIRFVSSHDTIMSFDMFMEEEGKKSTPIDKKTKPRKHIFEKFKPGICLGVTTDDDNQPYMPDENNVNASWVSKSEERFRQYETSRRKTERTWLGQKCKPGGCLDPPFGADTYSYTPFAKDHIVHVPENNGTIDIENRVKDDVNSTDKSTDKNKRKSKDPPISISRESKLQKSDPSVLNIKTDSKINSKQIHPSDDKDKTMNAKMTSDNKPRSSINDSVNSFYSPPKGIRRESSNFVPQDPSNRHLNTPNSIKDKNTEYIPIPIPITADANSVPTKRDTSPIDEIKNRQNGAAPHLNQTEQKPKERIPIPIQIDKESTKDNTDTSSQNNETNKISPAPNANSAYHPNIDKEGFSEDDDRNQKGNVKDHGTEKLNDPSVINKRSPEKEVSKTSFESVVDQTNVGRGIVSKGENREMEIKSTRPHSIIDEPNEVQNIIEKPNQGQDILKTLDDVPKIVEKPHEVQNKIEKPAKVQNIVQKPDEVQIITEKPNNVQNMTEKPNAVQNKTENPDSVQNITENPDDVQNTTENRIAVQNIIGKPDKVQNIIENPDKEQNTTEHIDAEQNIIEKSTKAQNIIEKPDEEQNATDRSDTLQNIIGKPDKVQNGIEKPDEVQNTTENNDAMQNIIGKPDKVQNIIEEADEAQNTTENIDAMQNIIKEPDKPQNLIEKPDKVQNTKENRDAEQNIIEKPDKVQNIIEKPAEVQNPKENHDAAQNIIEKPKEVQKVVAKPDEVQNITGNRDAAQNKIGKPEEIQKVVVKPDEVQNITGNRDAAQNIIGKPEEIQKVVVKPDEVQNITGNRDAAQNIIEKPDNVQNVIEKPDEVQNITENRDQAQNIIENPDNVQNVLRTSDDAQNIIKNPNGVPNIIEKSNEFQNIVEAPDEVQSKRHDSQIFEKPQVVNNKEMVITPNKDISSTSEDNSQLANIVSETFKPSEDANIPNINSNVTDGYGSAKDSNGTGISDQQTNEPKKKKEIAMEQPNKHFVSSENGSNTTKSGTKKSVDMNMDIQRDKGSLIDRVIPPVHTNIIETETTPPKSSEKKGKVVLPDDLMVTSDLKTVSLKLAFHSYMNNKNERIFKTIVDENEVDRRPNDSVTVINSRIKASQQENYPELIVPIDSSLNMVIRIENNNSKSHTVTDKPKTMPISNYVPNAQASKTAVKGNSVEHRVHYQVSQNDIVLDTTLTDIYEQELIPLQKMIRALKADVDVLAEQHILNKTNVICLNKLPRHT